MKEIILKIGVIILIILFFYILNKLVDREHKKILPEDLK